LGVSTRRTKHVVAFVRTSRAYQTGLLPVPSTESLFRSGFKLRCFQLLSLIAWLPGVALSDNRYTSGDE